MLIVFDIDGTLTRTVGRFDRCFCQAVEAQLDTGPLTLDWSRYPDVTDSAIVEHLYRHHAGRPPTASELADIEADYLGRLEQEGTEDVQPVPGAAAFLHALARNERCRVAVATGNWRSAAFFKLSAVGIGVRNLPMATASDATRRSDIVRIAMARAGGPTAAGTVYVGDGLWDAAAARALRIGFVGVAADGWGHALRRAGVSRVISDYRDPRAVIRTLVAARKTDEDPDSTQLSL